MQERKTAKKKSEVMEKNHRLIFDISKTSLAIKEVSNTPKNKKISSIKKLSVQQ